MAYKLHIGLPLFAGILIELGSPATAECVLPQSLRASPEAAARHLLHNAEFVGIVEVVTEGREHDEVPEVLNVLIPFKGAGERISLERRRQGTNVVVTNSSVSLGLPSGSIGLAALHRTSDGLVVSECTNALYQIHRPASIVRELISLRR